METSVSVYKNGNRFLADIHIDGVDVSNLHKFDNGYILSMVRSQVVSILQFGDGITDLSRLADYTSAIVDGIPLPKSSCQADKPNSSDCQSDDTLPHTEGGS